MRKQPALPTQKQLVDENAGLRARLDEAEDTLRAIRNGEVDALVVSGVHGERIFTLHGADRTYRMLIEEMNEGALTLTPDGMILYSNRCFARMIKSPLEKVIGSAIHTWIFPQHQHILWSLLQKSADEKSHEELILTASDGTQVPVYFSVNRLSMDRALDGIGLVVADLTKQKKQTEAIIAAEKLMRKVLEERQQLAYDLHDAINQTLFSACLITEVLPRVWEKDQAQGRQSLDDLGRLTRGALAELRTVMAELRPSDITDTDLGYWLQVMGNALSSVANIPVTVTVTQKISLHPEVQIAIYDIFREILNNIAKHAKASRLEIDLKQNGTAIELSIRDDGRGFDPFGKTATASHGHNSLSRIREKAEAVGARLSVTSQPGHGAELSLVWQPNPLLEVK